MMLVDSHCHLDDERLYGQADEIVASLASDGVGRVIDAGSDLVSSERAVFLAERFSEVYALVGVHPHEAEKATDDDFSKIENLAKNNQKVVGIGEIGLDYFYDLSPRSVQAEAFVKQLEIADGLKLPVAIHLRDAYGDMLEIVKQNADKIKHGFLLHCYSGSPETAKEFMRAVDASFAFGGTLTFKNNVRAVETVRMLPEDKLLLETDSPYLAPVPMRGKTNLPNYVGYVAAEMAKVRGVSVEEIANVTTKNAYGLFSRLK